jgi:hypothetical protein
MMSLSSDLFSAADELPAISLWQPWASLIFTGDKKHETRAFRFPAKYAGRRVAIHAAKALPAKISMGLHMLCEMNWGSGGRWRNALPTGVILGTVVLAEAVPTDELSPETVDRICGDWAQGRFAWRLECVRELPEPLPWKGKQGWFRVPASVDTDPKGGDVQQAPCDSIGSAVPRDGEADAQGPSQ